MSTKTVSSRISEENHSKLIETANKQGKPISIFLKELIENAVNNSKQGKQNDETVEVKIVDNNKKEPAFKINEEPVTLEVEPPEEDWNETGEEEYECGKCSYKTNFQFTYCPKCGVKNEWD